MEYAFYHLFSLNNIFFQEKEGGRGGGAERGDQGGGGDRGNGHKDRSSPGLPEQVKDPSKDDPVPGKPDDEVRRN